MAYWLALEDELDSVLEDVAVVVPSAAVEAEVDSVAVVVVPSAAVEVEAEDVAVAVSAAGVS